LAPPGYQKNAGLQEDSWIRLRSLVCMVFVHTGVNAVIGVLW
jgi:hypothetical protein